ncbi:hypothetical protein WJX77_011629 [Trebouxia sp. C0004]
MDVLQNQLDDMMGELPVLYCASESVEIRKLYTQRYPSLQGLNRRADANVSFYVGCAWALDRDYDTALRHFRQALALWELEPADSPVRWSATFPILLEIKKAHESQLRYTTAQQKLLLQKAVSDLANCLCLLGSVVREGVAKKLPDDKLQHLKDIYAQQRDTLEREKVKNAGYDNLHAILQAMVEACSSSIPNFAAAVPVVRMAEALQSGLQAQRLAAANTGAGSPDDYVCFSSTLALQQHINECMSHSSLTWTNAAGLAKEAWYRLRIADSGSPPSPESLQAIRQSVCTAVYAVEELATRAGTFDDRSGEGHVDRAEVAWLAHLCQQELAGRWDKDWHVVLSIANKARSKGLLSRMHRRQTTATAGNIKEQAQCLPAHSTLVLYCTLSLATLTSPIWDEIPQPAREPGLLAVVALPDGRVSGTVLGSDLAATFVQWAATSLPTEDSRPPSMLGALAHSIHTLSASDDQRCLFALAEQQDTLRHLHRFLLEPLISPRDSVSEALLTADIRHLIFVPDKGLALVPFAALWDGFKYLIQQRTVSVAPSLAVFTASKARFETIHSCYKNWVVVCNPESDEALRPLERALPGIRKAAAAFLASSTVLQPKGGEATSTGIMESSLDAGSLVIMCHGVMGDAAKDDQDGELLLSEGTRLSTRALKQLKKELHATMVLLYACNAGNGRRAAEGLLSMGYNMLYAGAACVVAPIWEPWVSVASSHCTVVCQELARGSALVDALQKAAVSLIEQKRSPHYWACFVCNGYPFTFAADQHFKEPGVQ